MDKTIEAILIVDDNESNLFSLSSLLEREGYQVQCIQNPIKAIELLKSQKFDLLLLDLMMPYMDGFEALQKIRADYSMLELPIIIVTIRDEEANIIKGLKMGANDYITKPISNILTIERIKTQLKIKALYQQKQIRF